MFSQIRYGGYFFMAGMRHVLKRPKKIRYDNKKYLDDAHANLWLRDRILGGEPFMACRFGSGELRAFLKVQEVKMGLRRSIPESNMDSMCINAGFFPRTQQAVMDFGKEMERACRQVDLIAIWETLPMENYVYDHYTQKALRCYLSGLEPFFCDTPWTSALKGKKVVVIHPFEDTIHSQYAKRKLLFKQEDILPEFELRTVKAVQTIGGQKDSRFDTWFQALDYMYEEAVKEPFDVAIIGCGAYGFPLAARLKAAGHQAIHMGGATQLLFGIRGNRWDSREDYRSIMNANWCRPAENEKPAAADKVEGSCYW